MPTYEYACTECTHQFEVFQSMKDEPVAVCPECGGRVKRLLSGGAGVIFKGSGFYSTDKGGAKGGEKAADAKNADAKKTDAGDKSAGKDGGADAASPAPCAACAASSGGAPPCAALKNAS